MSEITKTVIATNRYAPTGSEAVCLYNYNGAENLSMGQLIAAFAFRRAANCEARTVVLINQMNAYEEQLDYLTESASMVLKALGDDDDMEVFTAKGDWATARRAKILQMTKLSETSLPETIECYNDVMKAYTAIKDVLMSTNSSLDKLAIELESAVSRRDSTLNLSTTMIKHYMTGCIDVGANM